MNAPLRVYLVEDHPAIRESLRLLLDGTPGFACVGAVESAEEARASAPEPAPAAVLLDIDLPGENGLDALPALRAKWPEAEILMLTVFDDEARVFEALQLGASGYLVKSTPPDALLDAIRDAVDGGSPLSPSIARAVVAHFRRPRIESQLSEREAEVLRHLVQGLSYRDVADRMCLSVHTVKFHARGLFEKMQVKTRAEAVAHALLGHRP